MDRQKRQRRQRRIRARVFGTAERPRVSIYRSNRYVWAQLVDDERGVTLGAAHDKMAERVGQVLAEAAAERGIRTVVFDRSGYRYHGRVAALAEVLRRAGLVL